MAPRANLLVDLRSGSLGRLRSRHRARLEEACDGQYRYLKAAFGCSRGRCRTSHLKGEGAADYSCSDVEHVVGYLVTGSHFIRSRKRSQDRGDPMSRPSPEGHG